MDFLKFYYIGNFHKILCDKKHGSRENLACEILCSVQQTKKEKNGQGENKNGEGWNGTGWDFGPLCQYRLENWRIHWNIYRRYF